MITERNMAVLHAIVEDFITTNEPVGSKALLERHGFGVSSATIRNEMAVLEEEGYIAAPHTSSGRIPTDKGYRVFVDQLITGQAVTHEIQKNVTELSKLFSKTLDQLTDLDEKLQVSAQLLAKATGEAAVVQYPNLTSIAVRSIEFVKVAERRVLVLLVTEAERIAQHVVLLASDISDSQLSSLRDKFNIACSGLAIETLGSVFETLKSKIEPNLSSNLEILIAGIEVLIKANKQEKVAFAGTANLVRSEQEFSGGLSSLLHTFDEQSNTWNFLGKVNADAPKAIIGSENSVFELSTSSLLLSSYGNLGPESAKVAVVGPTRMNYARNLAALLVLSKLLSKDQED